MCVCILYTPIYLCMNITKITIYERKGCKVPCGYGISKSCCIEVYLFVEHDDDDAEEQRRWRRPRLVPYFGFQWVDGKVSEALLYLDFVWHRFFVALLRWSLLWFDYRCCFCCRCRCFCRRFYSHRHLWFTNQPSTGKKISNFSYIQITRNLRHINKNIYAIHKYTHNWFVFPWCR